MARTNIPTLTPGYTDTVLRRLINNMLGGRLNVGYDVALSTDSGTIAVSNSAVSPQSIITVMRPSLGFQYGITSRASGTFTLQWAGAGSNGSTISYSVVG